jgi:hypothetical protein
MLIKAAFIITLMLTVSVMVFPTTADQPSITHNRLAEQKTQEANGKEKNPDTINHPTTPSSPVIESHEAPELQPERAKGSDQGDNPKNIRRRDFGLTDRLLVIFTGLLVTVGALQAFTLWSTHKFATKTKRPFVFLRGIRFEEETKKAIDAVAFDHQQVVWKLWPYWGNNGDTSANAIISANCEIRDDKPPEDFQFEYVPQSHRSFKYKCHKDVKSFIAPRTRILNEPLIIGGNRKGFDDVVSGTLHLFLWGEAKYDNIVNKKTTYHARFCVELFFARVSRHTEFKFYNYCTDYNHAD